MPTRRRLTAAAAAVLLSPLLLILPLLAVPALVATGTPSGCAAPAGGGQLAASVPEQFRGLLQHAADTAAVPAPLLAGVVQAESNWNPAAVSPASAVGLTQLLPTTAAGLGVDPYDPAGNLAGGARYLRAQLDRFGDVETALAAYNAGPGRASRRPWPAQTRAYVPKVLGYAAGYGYLPPGADPDLRRRLADPAGVCAGGVGGAWTVVGDAACPVAQPNRWADTWGAPRSGGRTHKGADIFAAAGAANYATQTGVVRFTSSTLGGISLWVTAPSGDRFYYAHLSGYAAGLTSGDTVTVGEVVGYVGRTGNARHTPAHTHFEVHPGGGPAVNPTAYLTAVCG